MQNIITTGRSLSPAIIFDQISLKKMQVMQLVISQATAPHHRLHIICPVQITHGRMHHIAGLEQLQDAMTAHKTSPTSN